MIAFKVVFWLLIFGVCYTYILYGVILYIFSTPASKYIDSTENDLPTVIHIIAAFNEAEIIETKIQNALQLNYPKHKLKTVIIADGSTDATVERIKQYADITLLFEPQRKGKMAAINRAVEFCKDGDILVFSDANTMLNQDAFINIMRHFFDPIVGGVAAEKKVLAEKRGIVRGEGIYWMYESGLKKLEADFHSVIGAAGELFSVRRKLFKPLPENIILDDLMISLNICRKGYLVRYEPAAFALESPSLTLADERIRKIRISAGAFQALGMTTDLLNPFKFGKISFQYWSHRILRWVFCPIAIPLIFILNSFILTREGGYIFQLLYILQIIFYSLALIGWGMTTFKKPVRNIFYIPFYAIFMQIAIWKGFLVNLSGNASPLWQKVNRQYDHLNGL